MNRFWRPRLVALDIDGTLVDHSGYLPESVRAAVRGVVDAGIPVVLSTGRSWHATRPIFEALDLPPGPAVSSNGAVIVDYPPMRIRDVVTFDARAVIKQVSERYPQALLAVEVIGLGYRVTGHFPEGDLHGDIEVVGVQGLAAQEVTRVIVRDPNGDSATFGAVAAGLGLHGVSYFVGWSCWLDIAPDGVDKAHGLSKVCSKLGIRADDVLALGDGRNDIEMLRWAGRGVALGDAPDEVRAAADHVTDRFDDGGTTAELARWFDPAELRASA